VLWTLAAGLLGDPTEAEDVCQEAFLAAYAKRGQFEPGTNFQAWMGRFIRNGVANELRKRARRQTASTDPMLLDQGEAAPSGAGLEGLHLDTSQLDPSHLDPSHLAPGLFDEDQLDERLVAGLRELGEVPRSCLLLRTLRELSYAEIALLLEIPEGTAMSHVHRARTSLRAKLDPTVQGARP